MGKALGKPSENDDETIFLMVESSSSGESRSSMGKP